MFTRRVRNWEPSRVQLKKVIQSLKFSKLRQAWENPVLSVLQWVVLLQIINSDKQSSSKEKIVSIASILSKQKSEQWHNSPEQSRCYSFSLLLSFAMFLCKIVGHHLSVWPHLAVFVFISVSYYDSWHESGAIPCRTRHMQNLCSCYLFSMLDYVSAMLSPLLPMYQLCNIPHNIVQSMQNLCLNYV